MKRREREKNVYAEIGGCTQTCKNRTFLFHLELVERNHFSVAVLFVEISYLIFFLFKLLWQTFFFIENVNSSSFFQEVFRIVSAKMHRE